MNFDELGKNWDKFGKTDPFWAILTDPAKRRGKWDPKEFFQTGELEIAQILKYLGGMHLQVRQGAALDFGCGVGRLTQALADHFESAHGVDIAPSMIEKAKAFNRHAERCQYHVNGRPDLKLFDDASFDFIYSNLVLQHMRPQYSSSYIVEFLRLLKSGGVLVFQLPSSADEQHVPVARRPISGIKDAVRAAANRVCRAVTGKPLFPNMEMYGISRPAVEEMIAANGGHVADVIDDASGGVGWHGYRYCVTKS